MSGIWTLAASFVILLTLGCAASEGPKSLTIRPLARGGFSGIQDAREEVVKDPKRWEKIWAEHRGTSKKPIPEVDFAKEMVIVATMGRQRTGGYSIQVVTVEATGGKLKVHLKKSVPRSGDRAIQVLTAPYVFVAVPRVDLPEQFIEATNPEKR